MKQLFLGQPFARSLRSITMVAVVVALTGPIGLGNDSIDEAITKIKQVAPNGVGQDQAVAGIQILNKATMQDVPAILKGMNGANQLAVNWLRSAVISIVQRGGELPIDPVKMYFDDTSGSQLGRLLAFDLLDEAVPGWSEQTIPKLLDDPSLPLRRKAVDHWIAKAVDAGSIESIGYLGTALDKARDVNQVQTITKKLGEFGIEIDLQKQLGFLNQWKLVGVFDNQDEQGFDIAYGPEKDLTEIDLDASYTDKDSEPAKWESTSTVSDLGVVDLNEVVGPIKGVIVYAHTTFDAIDDRTAEIRIGCINAHKVWLNGELVMANEVYHNGMSPDKFSTPCKLKKGENEILVKICQNEQREPWAQRWMFQLRVCDETGKAIKQAVKAPSFN